MNALEVGNKLVAYLESHDMEKIYKELYSNDIVSIEADGQTARGMQEISAKGEWWNKTFEVKSMKWDGPYPNGDDFILFYDMSLIEKATNKESRMKEAALYTVKDGKIVNERFFFTR